MSTIAPETVQAPAEPGDHDLFAHYARKTDIEAAILDGVPCTALCGKTWLPNRDPQRFPVCPTCQDIYDNVVGTKAPGGDA
ncbi:DUF3039 domain-containing protein [Galactobacter valiniphilus]|uniref:DUF3039 domain-containing protein n=1 Tax=Galactobacter valiniphilus TaxID=2676122 RepID=UPI001F227523|nr:DUF3039 domain-containing protein [Galactobacter valiniphilus]